MEVIKVHRANKIRKGRAGHKITTGMIVVTLLGKTKTVGIGTTGTYFKIGKVVAVKELENHNVKHVTNIILAYVGTKASQNMVSTIDLGILQMIVIITSRLPTMKKRKM